MAVRIRVLTWRAPWAEEPGGIRAIGPQGVGHYWIDLSRNTRALSKRPLFFTVWKLEVRVPGKVRFLQACTWPASRLGSHGGERVLVSCPPFIRARLPSWDPTLMTARKPRRFPQGPTPHINTITISAKASTCGFRGDTYLNHSKKQVQNEKQAQLNLALSAHLQDLSILIRKNSIVYCFDFLFFSL